MVQIKTVTVGLTYNIGNFESKRADVTVKVKPDDSEETIRNFAVDKCASIISGDDPEVYKDCIHKLSGKVNIVTFKQLCKERRELSKKIDDLKSKLIDLNQWLMNLETFDKNQDQWEKLIDNPNFWAELNTVFFKFNTAISLSKNSEENEPNDDSSLDSMPVEEIM